MAFRRSAILLIVVAALAPLGAVVGSVVARQRQPMVQSPSDETVLNSPGTLPIVGQPYTITFCTTENYPPSPSFREQLLVWRVLEERTGVHVEFVLPENYHQVMSARIESGQELPDVLRVPGDNPMRYAYAGAIISLGDLIRQRAPNTARLLSTRPYLRRALTAPDGEVYVLGKDVSARTAVNYLSFGARLDWLDQMQLTVPETLEDWGRMLVAIRDGDPNGNGRADEIPFSTYDFRRLFIFGGAFGLHLTHSGGWYAHNGMVRYEWILPETKQLYAVLQNWYASGLIDPEIFSQSYEKFATKATKHMLGATEAFTMQYPMWNIEMSGDPDGMWGHLAPPSGPQGHRLLEKEQPLIDAYFGVSRDCERPDIAVQWLDYLFASEDGQTLMTNFGVEGTTYELVDGTPRFLESFLAHPKGTGVAQWELGMNGPFPGVIMPAMIEQRFRIYPEHYRKAEVHRKYHVSAFPRFPSTNSESALIESTMADIDTYVTEMSARFISGEASMEEFEQYVAAIRQMGIQRVVDVKQRQFERYFRDEM